MSKVVNNAGFKPGSIYRIALVNFVTYKEVVLYPGPSLNMIIGPNGTGKSTFVCAIILGLCGKTSVIGRAKKISDYVRTGCDDATIEIELYQKKRKPNIIITRQFDLRDISKWSIDKKAASETQVKELITLLNIQVDNLCQLLPQDRVQDFSKMNPQELLRSTLSAVGGSDSVEQLDELIETRNQQRGLSGKTANNVQILEEQTKLNERLKLIIDAMKQRKEIENQIKICEKKKLWLEYQELKEKVIEYSNDKKKAEKLVDNHKKKMAPLENVIKNAKSGISVLEQQKLKANREIHTIKDKSKEVLDSLRSQEFSLNDIEASFKDKLERHKNREQELIEAKAKMEKLIADKAALETRDEESVKMDLDKIVRELSKCNAGMDTLKKQKLEIQYDLENNIMPQIRFYQNKLRMLKDTHLKRLEVLREYSEDTYKALTWFRKNKNLFNRPVHEPMMLEINFTDPKLACYLEATVAARDLVAFTFESSSDMNLFLQKVRQEQGLKRVNAICSQGGEFHVQTNNIQQLSSDMNLFLQKVRQEQGLKRVNAICSQGGEFHVQTNNIQQLSYLGFFTYLVDTISAPDAIVRYLCKQYSIHKIPIGNEHTYNNSGRVPANITFFYTEKHRFTVRVSQYSNAKSSSTSEIRPARLLANTQHNEQHDNYTRQLSNFENNAESHKSRINNLDQDIGKIEVKVNQLNTQRKAINDSVQKVRTISVQIRMQTQKVRDIENEPTLNIQQEKEKCRQKQKAVTLQQCKLHAQLCQLLKKMQEKQMNGDIWKLLVAVTPQFAAFAGGGAIAYPSILLQQLSANDSSIQLDIHTSSWIGSIHGFTGIPAILMPSLMQWQGRKLAFLVASSISIIGWILAYFATNVTTIFVSESCHGLGTNSLMAVSMLSLSELVPPKLRSISMVAFFVIQSLGITTAGITATYLHWKTTSLLMGSLMVIAFLSALMWPQSPFWLAYKGEYDKCEQAFVWLRGTDEESMKELQELIAAQKENRLTMDNSDNFALKRFWSTLTSKDFYLPSIFMFLLLGLMYWSGSLVILIYGADLIFKSTSSKELARIGNIVNNVTLFIGITITNVLVRLFNNKSVLLLSSIGTALSLLCLGVILMLQDRAVLPKDSTMFLYFLIVYMFFNSLGINSLVFSMSAELMPVKHRGLGGSLIIIYTCGFHASSLKLAPYMFAYLGLSVTFFIYMSNVIICAFFVWKYIPETKCRTLQEIEDYYCNLKFIKGRTSVPILSNR